MENKKIIINNEWDEKWIREGRFMPLGSLLNAYGLINKGKGITADRLIKEVEKLAEYAQRLVEESYMISKNHNKEDNKKIDLSKIIEENKKREEIKKWQKRYNEFSELEEINKELMMAKDIKKEEEVPIIEVE